MAIQFPSDFDPAQHDSIPYGRQTLFGDDSTDEIELAGREAIRVSLEKRLGKKVVGRDHIATRFGVRNLGYSQNDVLTGKVVVR
jgi:ribosomal protein L27